MKLKSGVQNGGLGVLFCANSDRAPLCKCSFEPPLQEVASENEVLHFVSRTVGLDGDFQFQLARCFADR